MLPHLRPWNAVSVLCRCCAAILVFCTIHLSAQQATPYLLWPAPAPIPFLSPLTSVQLNAVALAGPPVGVSLAANYNVAGIATPGKPFAGGFDGNGESFSAAELGSQIQWNGIAFSLGAPDTLDVVSGGSVALPAGSYSRLLLLADLVNDVQPGTGTITVHYTDGSTGTAEQAFSDWVRARNNPNESTVTCVASRVFFNGSVEPNSTCVYGYTVALDSSKTVASVDLPANRNIVVLSMALLPAQLPGSFLYSPAAGAYPPVGTNTLHATFTPAAAGVPSAGTSVALTVNAPVPSLQTHIDWPVPSPVSVGTTLGPQQLDATALAAASPVVVELHDAARVNAFFHDGAEFRSTGFDGQNEAFSYQQLGPTLQYRGATFALGQPDVQDAASNNTIYVPSGSYTALYLLGAASEASPAQVFTLTYSDGTATQQTLDLSSWTAASPYADETVVATTAKVNLSTGDQRAVQVRVYGYTLPVDATRTLVSVTLPPNPAVVVLAAGLLTGNNVPVDGTMTYTPAAGTTVAQGNTALHVDFAPSDTTDFAPSQGNVTLSVLRPTLAVQANNATRSYGAPNPVFTGTVTGAIGGDQFTETFTTTAGILSAPGAYALVPAASGDRLSGYTVQVSPATLTVMQAATVVTLATASQILQGGSVTLNATVASTTSGTPTGQVSFLVNGAPFASAMLVQGSATLVTTSLPVGTNSVVAAYGGDANFLPQTSASSPLLVSVRDFLLTAVQPAVLKGQLGSSPTFLFHLAPTSGSYSADATFTLTGNLPSGAYATYSPGSVAIDAGPQDVTLTLHTSKFALLQRPSAANAPLLSLALLFGFLPLFPARRRLGRAVTRTLWIVGVLLICSLGAIGCGSGYAAQTYPLTLTATTGQVSHTLQLTLQIEATPQ